MKINFLIAALFLSAELLLGQTAAAPVSMDVPQFALKSTPVPMHLVYRHFLAMANDLGNKATAAGETDPYAFARPFARAGLANSDLDVLRKEAKSLMSDLAAHDVQERVVVANFRRQAQAALNQGRPMPPSPPELYQLAARRNALMVNHMVNLKANLGPETTAKLESYLAREFAPHISLKVLAHPPVAPLAQAAPALAQ